MTEHYKFCVSLRDVRPLIWREFMIRTEQNFDDLHYAIQDSCGWQDYQIYRFWSVEGNSVIARKDDYLLDDSPTPLGIGASLECYFEENRRCVYEYGHYTWFCDVILESRQTSDDNFERRLLGGARAFPLEDCGGRMGYQECVQVARAAELSADSNFMDKWGLMMFIEDWRPDNFDLVATKNKFDIGRHFKLHIVR